MRGKIALVVCVLFAITFFQSNAFAWFECGHRETALIAWDDLTPATRAKVAEVLKKHPRYEKDLLADLAPDSNDDETARFAFSSAAAWPDMVRSISNPMHATDNHPAWHYIDIPYIIKDQPLPKQRPPKEDGPKDIIEALTKSVNDLKDPALPDAKKAVALCWVLHLCGDIHQPLHTCTLISPQFPEGDQGGNSFIVLRDPPYPDSRMNLHFVWDSMPGEFQSTAFAGYVARGLKTDPKFTRESLKDALKVGEFSAWANESHALAIKYAYLNGDLVGAIKRQGQSAATQPTGGEAAIPGLPTGYISQAEGVAVRQIALAGYRTADLLNSIFDPPPVKPTDAAPH